MKKQISIICLAVLVSVLMFASCMAAPTPAPMTDAKSEVYNDAEALDVEMEEYAYDSSAQGSAPAPMATSAPQVAGESGGSGDVELIIPDTNRKIIVTQTVGILTENYEADKKTIMNSLQKCNGFVQNSDESGTKPETMYDSGRYANYCFRLPVNKASEFVDSLNGIGVITNASTSGQDVTAQYTDIELRLKTLQTRYDRLIEFLSKAEKLEDVVELEREIGNVTYEIESLKSQQRGLNDLITYVTVYVNLQEKNTLVEAPPTAADDSFGTRITRTFNDALKTIGAAFEYLVLAFVWLSPIIIPGGLIAIFIVFMVKWSKKRKQKKLQSKDISIKE